MNKYAMNKLMTRRVSVSPRIVYNLTYDDARHLWCLDISRAGRSTRQFYTNQDAAQRAIFMQVGR